MPEEPGRPERLATVGRVSDHGDPPEVIEGLPKEMVVTVRIDRQVSAFSDLERAFRSLQVVDDAAELLQERTSATVLSDVVETRVLSVSMTSPLTLILVVAPAWLAVLIALIANYPKIKANAPEVMTDAARITRQVRGIDEDAYLSMISFVRKAADFLEELPQEREDFEPRLREGRRVLRRGRDGSGVALEVHKAEGE